ncbi:hypothetical protein Psta_0107 [Pirellula staleyi DSM 6068]|uniref:Uncharacterized protein n=1 Tax=Pirellula staleyi (strain ATCC 27377 / DSM 6068 / ICPB 4128) TaxID=530564 RepID=D2R0D5_PIRSD|nr:hypothetical protein [Pirellula staleyi]ADB14803.1 hypothetical protein Psta_0107 [Pirellula staleyi DSM 6068]
MADDIEEFLRRAIQRRMEAEKRSRGGQAAEQPPQQAAPPPRPIQPPTRRQPPQQQRPRTIATPFEQPMVVEAEVIEAPVAKRAERMQKELEKDFKSSTQMGERVKRLGQEVGLADDNLDAHLHQTFDHTVGSLTQGQQIEAAAEGPRATVSPVATEVLKLLANPKSLAAAFILNEILQPNTNRFDHWK